MAIVHYMYGVPELLELRDIDPPVPKPKERAGSLAARMFSRPRVGTRPVRNE
jgi:hypothetical protein